MTFGLQTDGQTDGQMTCNHKTALCTIVHRTVKIELYVVDSIQVPELSIAVSSY